MNINSTNPDASKIQTVQVQPSAKMDSSVNQASGQQKNHDNKGSSPVSLEDTRNIVDSLKGYMDVLKTNIGFSVDKKTDQIIVKITNKETNEVIRQIPPESLVELRERMKELTGIIFSETV